MRTEQLTKKLASFDPKIRTLEKKLAKLKAKREIAEQRLLKGLKKLGMESARFGNATYTRRTTEFLNIEDPKRFRAFVIKTQGYDLLQQRVSSTAVRERQAQGVKVPGIGVNRKDWIQITKRRGV